MSFTYRKFYFSPGKEPPKDDIPPDITLWHYTDSVRRCGITWDEPGNTGAAEKTVGYDDYDEYPPFTYRRLSSTLLWQCVFDPLEYDITPSLTMFASYPVIRSLRTVPSTPTQLYPEVWIYRRLRAMKPDGSLRYILSDAKAGIYGGGLLPRTKLTATRWVFMQPETYGTLRAGDYLVIELGIAATVPSVDDEAYYEGCIELCDSADEDLVPGDIECKNSWGILRWLKPTVSVNQSQLPRYWKPRMSRRHAERLSPPIEDRTAPDLLNEMVL